MRCCAGVLLTSALAACALEEPVIELPINEDARAMIILLSGNAPEGIAVDLSNSPGRYFTLSRSRLDDRVAYVLDYDCALEALGVEEGSITFGGDGPMLAPPIALRRALPGGMLESIAELPPELARLRIRGARELVCRPLSERRYTIDERTVLDEVRFVLALDEDRALFATAGGVFSLIEAGSAHALTNLATTTPNLGAVLMDNGEVWLAGRAGKIVAGDPLLGFTARPSRTSTRGFSRIWLDGTPDDLYLVNDGRSFEHFDGTTWTTLYQGTGGPKQRRSGVVRVGPGEAIALGLDDGKIFRVHKGAVAIDPLEGAPGEEPTSVARIEGLGAVIGTRTGHLYRDGGAGAPWSPIALSAAAEIHAITALDGTLFFGGEHGVMSFGACAPASIAPDDVAIAGAIGATAYLLSNVVGGNDAIVEVKAPPPACGGSR